MSIVSRPTSNKISDEDWGRIFDKRDQKICTHSVAYPTGVPGQYKCKYCDEIFELDPPRE